MKLTRPRQFALLALLLGGVATGIYLYWAHRLSPAGMMGYLPQTGATLVYADIAQLRRGGIVDLLAGSKAVEDLEYKRFVERTGFDYRRDIDQIAGSLVNGDAFFLVTGRFDWNRLEAYMTAQNGTCRDHVCRGPASTPGRFTSFYPIRSNLMAIAFSTNELAALDIAPRKTAPAQTALPSQPVWASLPAAALRDSRLPAGAQSFTSPLMAADSIVFMIGPQENRFEMKLDVTCASPAAAADLLIKLEGATNMLRKLIEREHLQPNPRDLSGLLTSGSFRREDRKVFGTWPVHKEFVEAVAAGAVN